MGCPALLTAKAAKKGRKDREGIRSDVW